MPTAWEEPAGSEPQIQANVANVLNEILADAASRSTPSVAMAQQWHRDVYEGIACPYPYYAGEVRDSDDQFPDLIGYEVRVGPLRGVASAQVPDHLARFEHAARRVAARLDAEIPTGTAAGDLTPQQLHGILRYCAYLHGDWVHIHPFANGNGRTARLWVHWAAMRYGLPPFLRIKPRPAGNAYALAAMASMQGDHDVMVGVLLQTLQDTLSSMGGSSA